MNILLGVVSAASAFLFVLVFVLAPTRSGKELLGPASALIEKHGLFLLFASLLTAALCSMLRKVLPRLAFAKTADSSAAQPERPPSPHRQVLRMTLTLIATVALMRAGFLVSDAFDWDEIERITFLANGDLAFVANPMTTLNHPIATVLAYLSSLFLGLGKFGLRFPSLVFSALFLGALIVWGPTRFRGFSLLLVLFHLALNALALWYFQSMRGYITLMLATLSLLILVLEQLERPSRKKTLLVALMATATLFTHAFGAVFLAALAVSLIVWSYANRTSADSARLKTAVEDIAVLVSLLAAAGAVLLSQLKGLDHSGFLSASPLTLEYKLTRLAMVFGAHQVWLLKSALVLTAALALLRAREQKLKGDFLSVFVLTSLVFVVGLLTSLKVDILEGRMVLGFLVPWVLWVGESVSCLENIKTRLALGTATIALLIVPQAKIGTDLLGGDLAHYRAHEKFAAFVVERLDGTSHECISYSGEPRAVRYFSSYYLRSLPKHGTCTVDYHLYFSANQFGDKFEPAPSVASMEEIEQQGVHHLYSAPAGNYLASVK